MVTFNLLPWREYERNYQKQALKKIFFSTGLLALLFIIILHIELSQQVTKIKSRIAILTDELNQYHQQTRHDNYTKKNSSAIVKQLFKHRGINKKLIIALGNPRHENICFSEVFRVKNTVSFNGVAFSIADLTQFLKHWDAASFFAEIRIKQIEQQESGLVKFAFQAEEASGQS